VHPARLAIRPPEGRQLVPLIHGAFVAQQVQQMQDQPEMREGTLLGEAFQKTDDLAGKGEGSAVAELDGLAVRRPAQAAQDQGVRLGNAQVLIDLVHTLSPLQGQTNSRPRQWGEHLARQHLHAIGL
jgi:hypothetical protein